MRRARLSIPLVGILLTFGAGGTATAQQGVTVDPDSAPAKEYAIPLEAARHAAAGTKKSGDTPAPRFGQGVGDDDSVAASKSPTPASGGARKRASDRKQAKPTPAAPQTTSKIAGYSLRPGVPEGGGVGSALVVLGGAAALLLLGGGLGYALRRRGGPSTA